MLSITLQLVITLALAAWVGAVVLYISKAVYRLSTSHGLGDRISRYMARKTIHILGGGLVAALVPFVYTQPWMAFASAMALTGYILYRRRRGLMTWFQEPDNAYEAHFTIMWGLVILAPWFFDPSMVIGAVSALFMSVGDGITGVVRGLRRVRGKAWSGTIAMIVVSSLIGGYFLGLEGVAAGVVASFVERINGVDDNITVPLVSFLLLLAMRYLLPAGLAHFPPRL
ncbi:dolichol kinase [Acidilobus sp.]|jgi:dolichol kinase|uniref:dolichol kinase n=1 Tax=Acidilobus sp. TaxID=1872109 RepID=UPI003D059486